MIRLPATDRRVAQATSDSANAAIADDMLERLRHYARHPELIDQRIRELDREWDIERTLQANASSLALSGLAMGTFVDRRFLALPAIVMGFLLQHALQGWCPPLPLFRRLGVRTTKEITQERFALMALRGDFRGNQDTTEAPDQRAERIVHEVAY